jgi:hypothetical protein
MLFLQKHIGYEIIIIQIKENNASCPLHKKVISNLEWAFVKLHQRGKNEKKPNKNMQDYLAFRIVFKRD